MRVRDEMTPAPLWSLKPGDPAVRALELLAERAENQALILDEGRLVGMLTTTDIAQYLQHRKELGIERRI